MTKAQSLRHLDIAKKGEGVTQQIERHTISVMVDGPSPDSELVLTGRLAGQAPDIDAIVVLDECDPSAYAPGAVIPARITGARGYDLVAVPLPA